jgi:anti-sigma factor RsiW
MRSKLDCERIRPLIDAAVDGELDAINQMSFDDHLATCPDCANVHAERLAFVRRLRDGATRFAPPESLRERLLAELPRPIETKPVRAHHPWRLWLSGGAWGASALALAVSVALFLSFPSQQDALMHELVAAHVRSLMPEHLTDVPSSDRHTVKPWFNGKVGLSPAVPNLADQGFPLVGGRLDYVDDRTAAALVYRRNQHIINLFVWAAPGALAQPPSITERNGYHLLTWTGDGLRYAAVSDVAATDLKEFQHLWSTAAAEGEPEKTAP